MQMCDQCRRISSGRTPIVASCCESLPGRFMAANPCIDQNQVVIPVHLPQVQRSRHPAPQTCPAGSTAPRPPSRRCSMEFPGAGFVLSGSLIVPFALLSGNFGKTQLAGRCITSRGSPLASPASDMTATTPQLSEWRSSRCSTRV
jgi:hypothetical protein